MLKEEKKRIISDNYVMNKRQDAKLRSSFLASKHRTFIVACLTGFLLLAALYFWSPFSKIFKVAVKGNYYLRSADIQLISELDDNSRYLLNFPWLIQRRLQADPYIESAKVSNLDGRVIAIEVQEKKQIGYLKDERGVVILFADGSQTIVTNDKLYLLTNIPYVEGFTSEEQLNYYIKAMKDVDSELIDQFSEVHRYPFSYDENMLEIVMRDGNYVFVSWTGINLLEGYYLIVPSLEEDNVCLYIDDVTNSGYSSACPWAKSESAIVDEP